MAQQEKEITFKITRQIGIVSKEKNGWNRELNWVSWNGAEPKWDIRGWNEDHTKCNRGITFSDDEARAIKGLLAEYEFE